MSKVVAVIAAYDERENIEAVARRLHAALTGLGGDFEMIFVVEGADGTREILEGLAPALDGLRILYQATPSGLGNAFRRGFAAVPADADAVVTLDADLNHQPEEIPRLLASLEHHQCDIVVGSRFVADSRVEGTPVWKRLLSGVMNTAMRFLYGVATRDKTSGFRCYRAAALRQLRFQNSNFAFLPELLIAAHRARMTIVEEPIHFIYRRDGRSKLAFWQTVASYIGLLRGRLDRWSIAAIVLLALAVLVRVALAMPVHKYPADADGLLVGMGAFKVLRGETPVFFSGTRIGSLECHAAAALFALFGAGRAALLGLGALLGVLLVGVLYLFAREAAGRRVACWSLPFVVLPPLAVAFWTYVPNGYATVELLSALTLWLATRLARRGLKLPTVGALGLVVGLGFWHSFLTLAVTVPALFWLLWSSHELRRSARGLALLAFAAVLGAAPWIAFNIRYPLATFADNFAARPAPTMAAASDNARYFAAYSVPELVASLDPQNAYLEPAPMAAALRWPAALVLASALVWWLVGLAAPARAGNPEGVRAAAWLPVLVVLGVAALNIFSEAGQLRGLTVRYVLQIWLVLPLVLGWYVASLARDSRLVAALAALSVLALNAAGLVWLDREQSAAWQARAQADQQLVELLRRAEAEVVVGPYWTSLPIGFLSKEEILALPCHPGDDHYRLSPRLPKRPAKFALVAPSPPGTWTWAEEWYWRHQLTEARLETSVPEYDVVLPVAPAQDPEQFLARVRAVCLAAS